MKKQGLLTIITIILTLQLLFMLTVSADFYSQKMKIESVFYDKVYGSYSLIVVDTNGEAFIVDLFKGKYNKNILKSLKTELINKTVMVDFDDLNTKDIYDDYVIDYYIEG